jgi:O-antigen ligase
MTVWLALGGLALVCAIGGAIRSPVAATVLWILAVETTPDLWFSGPHETLIGAEKGAGVAIVILLGFRFGWRRDCYNPGFAFAAMFFSGLLHGLYPGLTLLSSLRSLVGSAAPFAFGFTKMPPQLRRAVVRSVTLGPLVNILAGVFLNILHLHGIAAMEGSVFRLAGAGLPAFLGGFASIAIYAGLMEIISVRPKTGTLLSPLLLLINFLILLLTGARTPLALASLLIIGVLLLRRQRMMLAAAGALLAIAVLFLGKFNFIRVVDLVQLGQAGNLSNRNLIWPYFEAAIAASPWLGWGVGAGKAVVPVSHGIAQLIGTNAAHNEYLRIGCEGGLFGTFLLILSMGLWAYRGARHLPSAERWLAWVVFIAFAVHSATDNTLIATTSSVMFIWTSAVFSGATPEEA